MIVLCIEGCHGCGKTELVQEFEKAGYWVLDEAFLDMPEYALHPQSLLMETQWVCSWFTRLLKKEHESRLTGEARNQIFIADRSPYSAVFYASNGHLLEPVIREQIKEVVTAAGIEIYTVYLKVEDDILWYRIQDRLKQEPWREKYNEGSREWMDTTVNFYKSREWDFTVENNHLTIAEVMSQVVTRISATSVRFSSSPLTQKVQLRASACPLSVSTHHHHDECSNPQGSPGKAMMDSC